MRYTPRSNQPETMAGNALGIITEGNDAPGQYALNHPDQDDATRHHPVQMHATGHTLVGTMLWTEQLMFSGPLTWPGSGGAPGRCRTDVDLPGWKSRQYTI